MATKVLSFELGAEWDSLGVHPGYDHAMVLLRSRGVPLGKLLLPLTNGRVNVGEFAAKAEHEIWWPLIESRLRPDPFVPLNEPATVIVCTRERPDDLRRCLQSLLAMPDDGQEILVVDNNPRTTATFDLVSKFPTVRYLREDQAGANSARNCGILAARTELLAFIDDDAAADPNWLRAIIAPFRDPRVWCVTGLTMPIELETPSQEIFEQISGFSRCGFTARCFRAPAHNPLMVGPVGASVNMATRRSLKDRIGLMDPALGPGTPSMSGDDHEYFRRILCAGYTIMYEPAALNWHRHRRNWEELSHVMFAYGVGVYASMTRSMVVAGEWHLVKQMFGWFRYDQAPELARSLLRRKNAAPMRIMLHQIYGCWIGPWRYLSSRRRFPKYRDV
jgi:GT2 family glycosyltransferase